MEIIEWWFSYSKLAVLAVINFYELLFDWFDNKSISNICLLSTPSTSEVS